MTTTSLDIMTMTIPNSLRTIGPFLEEAQSIMRSKDSGKQKVTIFCIDHALKLVGQFGLSIGKQTTKCKQSIKCTIESLTIGGDKRCNNFSIIKYQMKFE